MGEPRPLPPGSALYFREAGSCHGPVWWTRAIATGAGELVWDNPLAKLPPINTDNRGPENWGPQLARVSASGQTLVARVCERGACMTFDRVDEDAVEALWGSTDAGETWERWGDYPDGGVWGVSETDVAFRDTDGRVKGLRSGEEWVPPEPEDRPSPRASGWGDGWRATARLANRVWSKVDDRLSNHEREPGQLDLFLHFSDPGAVPGAYSWGGEGSYESHRPLWLVDHLEGQLFVGFLGSEACGDGTKTVLVDFSSGTVHMVPGLDPGADLRRSPILYTARLTEPPAPSPTPEEPVEPDSAPPTRPALPTSPTYAAPPGAYIAITVGASDACALTEAGEAVCWDIETAETWDTPPGFYNFVTAEGGDACSIAEGGELACLSRGEDPWTPLGEGTARYTAVVDDCGLTEEGAIECWGVWPGTWPDPPSEPLVAIGGLRRTGGFGAEHYHRCALTATGDIICWGSDTLSRETWRQRKSGDYVALAGLDACGLTSSGHWDCLGSVPTGEERYVAISTTGRHHCAIATNGKAVCGPVWRVVEGAVARMIPPDPSPERFVAISVGESPDWESGVDLIYACALTDSGRAVCWANEPNTLPRPGAEHGPYVAVSDGAGHTCALTTTGEAVCWGWNNFGQADVPPGRYTALSAGNVATCAITDEAEAVCWGGWAPEFPRGSYVDISTGYERACALTAQGEVLCGNSSGLITDRHGPLAEIPPGPFAEVTFRWTHACARTAAGDLECWGYGYGATEVPPGRYLAVSVHDSATCAITDTGEAACWGSGPNDPPSGTYVAISTGERHACVLTENGEAACWGSFTRLRGEEGYGAVTPPPGEYTALSSSSFRTCALTAGGGVVCWGDEGYQQRPWYSPE